MLSGLEAVRLRTQDHRCGVGLLGIALVWVTQVNELALHVLVYHGFTLHLELLVLDDVTVGEECSIGLSGCRDLLAWQYVDQFAPLVEDGLRTKTERWHHGSI